MVLTDNKIVMIKFIIALAEKIDFMVRGFHLILQKKPMSKII